MSQLNGLAIEKPLNMDPKWPGMSPLVLKNDFKLNRSPEEMFFTSNIYILTGCLFTWQPVTEMSESKVEWSRCKSSLKDDVAPAAKHVRAAGENLIYSDHEGK